MSAKLTNTHMLRDLLQGKPLGHPLHPMLVHLPIGLLALSFAMDVGSFITGWRELVVGAEYTMIFGVVTALVAAVPGFADYSDIRADHPAARVARAHMILNLVAVALYAVNAVLRWDQLNADRTPALPFVLSLAGMGVLSYSGYLGGVLVYDNGIGVGRHRRRGRAARDTVKPGQFATTMDRFVVVANDAGAIEDGQTLRAEVNGVVIAVARQAGRFYAFQEFCTHRFGPLSEGCMRDGKIVCPWHRSEFDMATGKVAQGPAKVDLKAYECEVREGKLVVREAASSSRGSG